MKRKSASDGTAKVKFKKKKPSTQTDETKVCYY